MGVDRSRKLITVLLLVGSPAIFLFILTLMEGMTAPPAPASPQPPILKTSLLVNVEGSGRVLVNGSEALGTVTLPAGSSIAVEAKPADGWRLKSMLVNGTPVSPPLTLIVRGNTTVKVVFERTMILVRISAVGNGSVYVNGSLVLNGTGVKDLELKPRASLLITLVPSSQSLEGRLYVNGSKLPRCSRCAPAFLVEAGGDTEIRAVFEPRRIALSIDAKNLTVILSARNWTQRVEGRAVIGAVAGEPVNITTLCVKLGGGDMLCAVAWLVRVHSPQGVVNGSALPNSTIMPLYDTELEAMVDRVKGTLPPPATGGVLLNGSEVPAQLVPAPGWLGSKPFDAKFKYLGNGTWLIDTLGVNDFVLQMPTNWSTVTVEVWVDYIYTSPYFDVNVVLNEIPVPPSPLPSPPCVIGGRGVIGSPLTSGYHRVVFTRQGKLVEAVHPNEWASIGVAWTDGSTEVPLLRDGYLNFIVKGAVFRVRVSLSP